MKKFITVTLFSGLLTLLRMASGFAIAKVVAIYTGPNGMAVLGQVQNLVSAMNGIVSAPAGNGVVRYTAEYQAEGFNYCAPWWKAAVQWIGLLLIIVVPTSCLFSKALASWLFNNESYSWLVVVTAICLPLAAINNLIASVLNGQHQYRRFIALGTASVTIATAVMLVMVSKTNLNGVMAATVLFTSISGTVMLAASIGQPWFRLKYWWGKTEKAQINGIGRYVAMAVTSATTAPLSLLAVRTILVNQVGWEQAGQWQAVWRISEIYLGVITTALSTYFLPKLASLNNSNEILKEVETAVKIVMPVVLFLALSVYLLRDLTITFVFTEDFRPARDLFAIQLVGDVIKIASWIYAYPMLSRSATKWFIVTEIAFSASFVVLAHFLVSAYGVHGANFAYAANYCLYFIFVYKNIKRFSQ